MMGAQREGGAAKRSTAARGPFNYDLAVAYRIYPKVSKPAQSLPFGNDKLRQAEICLGSFRNSLGPLRVKFWAILDGCPEEYRELFQRYFSLEDLVFVELDRVGNRATYAKQLDILLSQREAEVVYLAEDDYLYLPDQFPLMLRFLRDKQEVDFLTPYDHPDCYQLDLHREPKWLTVFEDHHWRTAASTCLTFLTRKSTLAKYERALRTYSRGSGDCAMWLSLTKRRVFNPLALLQLLAKGEFSWKILVKAWLFCWRQIVFGKAVKLWVPMPGLATHLCAGLFSPGVDWFALMQGRADGVGPGEVPRMKKVAGSATGPLGSSGISDSGRSARVVVLVLNWNNWKDTNECLESLRSLDYGDWKTLVLDNGSTDDSVRHIRERFPEVEIMELGANLGFAKGNNAGIRVALERGAEYVWLLNNDTTVDPKALRAMVERAQADPKIGAVGSAIYYTAEPERLQVWGGGYVNFWLGRPRPFLRPVADEKIQFLTGSSLLLRRSALESVGLLDEAYFLYWEDTEICFRIRRAGWRLTVAGDSKVWHKVNATIGENSVLLDTTSNRSAARFFQANSPVPLISIWVGVVLRIARRALTGDWARVRAVWAGLRSHTRKPGPDSLTRH